MEYTSNKEDILYPEYGRHVQNLVKYALTIEDKAKRQSFVEGIIELMGQILPEPRNLEEQKTRFWNHIFHIADYKLDVTPPEDVEIVRVTERPKPQKLDYPTSVPKNRHYGSYVQALVRKALEMEDKEKQIEFVKIIGNYMKTAYRTWNSEHFVSDEMIIADLAKLSDGAFVLDEDMRFVSVATPANAPRLPRLRNGGRTKNGKNRRNRGNGRNKRRRY